MLGWEFPVEYCERPHYLVDFERDVFYFPNADVRVLGRALGRVRNAALSLVEIGFCDGSEGGSEHALVPEWVVGGVVSEEEWARMREELIVQKSRFREWDGWQEESSPYLEKKPDKGEKFLKSLVLVGDGERVLMGMEDKLETGTLRDFEYSHWEWVGDEMPLPIERTGLDEEPDHPYWELHGKRLDSVKRAFESELVRQAYEGIAVKFELWRRPRQEGYWERRAANRRVEAK
ncbi:hypothetical protein BKA61DRAFT_619222 [Leptodontidium sp. MPI-SDFR-AT-0119]|nr:hypothetical protein BKA61DRAFT_619222 [Leptodontidium sp. MPI-SDFR-AT-0119]